MPLGFWAFCQVAHVDFDLVKLAHLHGNVRKRVQQAAFAVTDNALYHNTFLSQCSDRLRVERIGFPLNCHDRQGALAASVVENHDAPFSAEIGGVHDDVGFLRQRVALPDLHTAKAAIDGFAAASILLGKLRGRLFACAISCPKLVVLKALAAVKTFAASLAFISLLAILPAIFFDLL